METQPLEIIGEKSLEERFHEATRPPMVRIAPGIFAPVIDGGRAPKFTLAKYVDQHDGTYRLVPVLSQLVRVSNELLHLLGLSDSTSKKGSYNTLIRLANAGFVTMVKVSPKCYMLDLDSWARHISKCAKNPDRFEPGSPDREVYLFRNGLSEKQVAEKPTMPPNEEFNY